MSTHPLIEIQFELRHFGEAPYDDDPPESQWATRHRYHVPRIGDHVFLTDEDPTFAGRVYEVLWRDEVVIVRLK